MKSVGQLLREAREAKGLSVSQVAEGTRSKSQVIQALEQDDYSKFAAPIYTRGFIKLVAEYLGLDASELISLYQARHAEADRKIRPASVLKPGPSHPSPASSMTPELDLAPPPAAAPAEPAPAAEAPAASPPAAAPEPELPFDLFAAPAAAKPSPPPAVPRPVPPPPAPKPAPAPMPPRPVPAPVPPRPAAPVRPVAPPSPPVTPPAPPAPAAVAPVVPKTEPPKVAPVLPEATRQPASAPAVDTPAVDTPASVRPAPPAPAPAAVVPPPVSAPAEPPVSAPGAGPAARRKAIAAKPLPRNGTVDEFSLEVRADGVSGTAKERAASLFRLARASAVRLPWTRIAPRVAAAAGVLVLVWLLLMLVRGCAERRAARTAAPAPAPVPTPRVLPEPPPLYIPETTK